MTGKKLVLLVVGFSVIVLILGWLFLQYIIVQYDLDSAIHSTRSIVLQLHHKSSLL